MPDIAALKAQLEAAKEAQKLADEEYRDAYKVFWPFSARKSEAAIEVGRLTSEYKEATLGSPLSWQAVAGVLMRAKFKSNVEYRVEKFYGDRWAVLVLAYRGKDEEIKATLEQAGYVVTLHPCSSFKVTRRPLVEEPTGALQNSR